MTGRLKGKVAVVTAAGQGIGRAIAEMFVAEGATVYASDVSRDKLDGLKRAKKAKLDVLSTRAVEAYAAKVGPVDILVNVAGFVHHGTVLDTSEKDWDFSFDLNVKSMHRTIKAFLPGMLERAKESGKTSSIVNISSGASSIRGIPNRYAYGASKAAVIGLTKSVAADFIRQGIRCNADCARHVQVAVVGGSRRDARQRMGQQGKGAGYVRAAPADGACRRRNRNRACCRLPRIRRGRVHNRYCDERGRRLLALMRGFAMTPENRNSAIAAAVLLAVFGVGAFYLPTIMVAVGNVSTIAAGIIAVLFVVAFFGVFWLRGRSQKRRGK